MEIGNQYWEHEDNCVLKNNIDIDILYRDLDSFCEGVSDVAEKFQAHNGYTTCMWHNLLNCKIICDKNGRLKKAKERFDIPYPDQLRDNIIKRNTNLLYAAMPAYSLQIKKACARNDRVSIVHRTAAFLESYFDVLFAVNRQTHPGKIVMCFRKTLMKTLTGCLMILQATATEYRMISTRSSMKLKRWNFDFLLACKRRHRKQKASPRQQQYLRIISD